MKKMIKIKKIKIVANVSDEISTHHIFSNKIMK
jgi:hypothetical protein